MVAIIKGVCAIMLTSLSICKTSSSLSTGFTGYWQTFFFFPFFDSLRQGFSV